MDEIYSLNKDGSIQKSKVIALHDHGIVQLWKVKFDNGSEEICTLDHKWETKSGKMPLWNILKNDEKVISVDNFENKQDISYKKIIQLFYVGEQQGYDIEVDHPQHNFMLASGLMTSNSHAVSYGLMGYYTAYLKRIIQQHFWQLT